MNKIGDALNPYSTIKLAFTKCNTSMKLIKMIKLLWGAVVYD